MKFHLYFSPDGFEWTAFEGNPVIDYSPKPGRWGPTDFMGWDPVRQVYAVHMENNLHWRGPLGKRVIGRAESPDMIHWSEAETILVPGEADTPDTEYYSLAATAYEGLYVGVLWNFRTTNLTHHPQIVFSRNGIHYNREYREPFIARGPRGRLRRQLHLRKGADHPRRPRPRLLLRHQQPLPGAGVRPRRESDHRHRTGDAPPRRVRFAGRGQGTDRLPAGSHRHRAAQ